MLRKQKCVLTLFLLSLRECLTAEEGILVTVVPTVVIAITQVTRIDADVGSLALDLARRTCAVSWNIKS